MKCEWESSKIGDLGKIITGKTPPTKNQDLWDGNIPFITPRDLQNGKTVLCTERTITSNGIKVMQSVKLPPKSVCVSCIGNIGYVAMTYSECISNQQINSIIVNSNNDADFVYYLMKSLHSTFKNYEGQSTTLSILNKKHFSDIDICIPPLDIQKKIAAILSALDEKIATNRAINENLLAQAQTLYKQFFPYGVQNDLPDGWRIGTVGEIIEIHDSKRIPLSGADRSKMEKKIYPYYGAASLMDLVDNYIFDGKYLLLGEDGTVVDDAGYPILQYVWGQFWVNNHAHILTGRLGYDVESLYMLFKQTPVKSIVTGAVQPKISQANLRSVQVVIPPEHNLREYNDLVEPLFSLFRANEEECKDLTALRDTLLPKLMSGEIDVSAVQL